MKRMIKLLLKRFIVPLAAAVALAGGTAARAQTVYGPGGLFVHPSAFVPEGGGVSLNASWFSQTVPGGRSEWIPVSLTANIGGQAQLGLLHVERRIAAGYRGSNGAFGKYQFLAEAENRPALAIAGSYLSGDIDQSSISGVLSYNFRNGEGRTVLAAHLGGQWVRRADIPGVSAQDDTAGFLGVEVPLGSAFRLVGETSTKLDFNRKPASAYGVMWSDGGGFSLGVGYVNAGRSDSNRFFVGVGYPLGGGR